MGARFGFHNGLVVQGVNADDATGSGWISNPTPFSFVLTGSRMDDRRGFDDIEESYDDPTYAESGLQPAAMRQYDYHRRRFGYGGEFDFKPNDDHHYYIRANVAGYTESVIKNRLDYLFDDTSTPAAGGGFTGPPRRSFPPSRNRKPTAIRCLPSAGRIASAGPCSTTGSPTAGRPTTSPTTTAATGTARLRRSLYNNIGEQRELPVVEGH